jgi:hypothetical protein
MNARRGAIERAAFSCQAAALALLLVACAQVPMPEGCPASSAAPQTVAPTQPDEAACLQFSIDATQEPGTLNAPTVLPGFPLDPANHYRLTVLSTSVPWSDGGVPATPESGWTGWRSTLAPAVKQLAVCPRARMYQAVCAPSGAADHCNGADGATFQPDRIGAAQCFVNDWAGHYANNAGCVAVRLCKLAAAPATAMDAAPVPAPK